MMIMAPDDVKKLHPIEVAATDFVGGIVLWVLLIRDVFPGRLILPCKRHYFERSG